MAVFEVLGSSTQEMMGYWWVSPNLRGKWCHEPLQKNPMVVMVMEIQPKWVCFQFRQFSIIYPHHWVRTTANISLRVLLRCPSSADWCSRHYRGQAPISTTILAKWWCNWYSKRAPIDFHHGQTNPMFFLYISFVGDFPRFDCSML